ncbi:LexA family protein [Asticcacaulis sp.]|uniref:LexA family protein n=1 Tax=Asticcacaulis sp. TaxID=1872648 RepID=UPI003F7CAF7D
MTPLQGKVLTAIETLTHDGVCPSYDEIGRLIGLRSRGGVRRVIDALEAQGRIARTHGRARTLTVLPEGDLMAKMRALIATEGEYLVGRAFKACCAERDAAAINGRPM